MGDRTTVTLHVLKCHEAAVEKLHEEHYRPEDSETDAKFAWFTYQEINYGNLDFEEDLLQLGIPYTKQWDAGGNFTAGESTLRFDSNGRPRTTEVSIENQGVCVVGLMEVIERNEAPIEQKYEELQKIITAHYQLVTPLPWDNQAEYASIYLANKLIGVNLQEI